MSGLGLILHPTRDVTEVVGIIERWATRNHKSLMVRAEDKHRVPASVEPVPERELAVHADALISIGGDGTMLGALRSAILDPKPVLGVHLGRLGFLVEIEPPELPDALSRLLSKDFTIESHACLACDVCGDDIVAFNDIALVRQPGSGFVTATLAVDGQQHGYYRADAVVVSTPIGSTAYSFAAGGPLISPAVDAVVITPSAPMAGISRSVVLSGDEKIRLELEPDSSAVVVELDGLVFRDAATEGAVDISYRRNAGLVVRFDPLRYQERNQLKMGLLDLPFLPEQLREPLPRELRRAKEDDLPPPC